MTIKQKKTIQNFSQQKKVLVFDEKNGELSETADIELPQECNVHQKLRKTLWHAASHQQQVTKPSQNVEQSTQRGKVEGKGNCSIEETQLDKEHVNLESRNDGSNDQLLILANSAALMLESDGLYGKDQNLEGLPITPMAQHSSGSVSHATITDHKSPGEVIEGTPVMNYVRTEEDEVHWCGRTPRLSQIRRQARSRSNLLVQQGMEESAVENLQGRRVRLNHIRHQAQFKYHSQLQTGGDSKGRIVRLSELRRQARTKDNQKKRVIADIFGEEDVSKGFEDVDCHPQDVESMHEYNLRDGVNQSVPESEEDQDKMICVRGRMRLSQLRREARLGNTGTLDTDNICGLLTAVFTLNKNLNQSPFCNIYLDMLSYSSMLSEI
ncbi:hypothetical protein JCGZ_15609 [Jatropha curcas]|uniref:Uncharacterized protein n=1 Tax=Jatropha curcas TaxID=180498 RepID=A0A067KYJ0_JATCU|nr:uncharacterized protein LOC105630444 isoform X2 [Jatropha curcas]KDP41202.1 hypothetical protein JCGZ_15609 [Jatropha curcas]